MRRQLVSALPIASKTVDGQRKATTLGKIQVVTPSTPHAGIRENMISSVLLTCVVNHVAASVSESSSMEEDPPPPPSLWTTISSSGMGRMSELERVSRSGGVAPGNLGCHASRSLWTRGGFWLFWSGLVEAIHLGIELLMGGWILGSVQGRERCARPQHDHPKCVKYSNPCGIGEMPIVSFFLKHIPLLDIVAFDRKVVAR